MTDDLIDGVLPCGTIATFSGPPHVGKTTMLASWCARLRDGRPICGHATTAPTRIAMLLGDRSWQQTSIPFVKAGCADLPVHSLCDDPQTQWGVFRGQWRTIPLLLGQLLDKLGFPIGGPPGGLLILDPLALWIPGNVNDYKTSAIGLGELRQVIRPRHLTLIAVHHQAKQKGGEQNKYVRPHDRILGSTALIGYSDTTIYMLGPEDLGTNGHPAPFAGLGWLPHNAPPETFYFQRDAEGLFIPYDGSPTLEGVGNTPAEAQNDSQSSDYLHIFLSFIPDAFPIRTSDLVKCAERQLHLSRSSTMRYLRRLSGDGIITRVGDGWQKTTMGVA